mmetsp:Transcript_72965/g.171538  ORF Transcript_72965/g.171538 Transcript_72965/m.171538 type:complete len:98 (-) Transcript_72965:142-435(-)
MPGVGVAVTPLAARVLGTCDDEMDATEAIATEAIDRTVVGSATGSGGRGMGLRGKSPVVSSTSLGVSSREPLRRLRVGLGVWQPEVSESTSSISSIT